MKIAVYLEKIDPDSGGGFTFQSSILRAIAEGKDSSPHEFVFVTRDTDAKTISGIEIISLSDFSNTRVRERPSITEYGKRFWKKLVGRLAKSEARYLHELEIPFKLLIAAHNIRMVWFASLETIAVKVPFIATVWDLQHRLQPYFPEVSTDGWDWQSREDHYSYFLPRASAVVVGTMRGKEEVERFYGVAEEIVHVIPFAIPDDVVEFDAPSSASIVSPLSEGERYLLYPAQFWPHKNHVGLLDAVATLERNGENQFDSLLLVGADKGNLKFVKDYANSLNLKTNIHFMGFIEREALLQLYSQALLLVFPSFFGPDNIPPLEALGLGCPVCAADVPGAREQLGDLAWYFDPADPEKIASQLQLVLAMTPEERKKRVASGMALNKTLTGKNYLKAINAALDELTPKLRCWEAGYFHTDR